MTTALGLSSKEKKLILKIAKDKRDEYLATEDIVDLQPKKTVTSMPILFAPGWASSAEAARDFLTFLAKKHRVLSLNHCRKIKLADSSKSPLLIELQKSLSLLELLKKKKINYLDAIAHSEGAINLLLAAYLEPEKFRQLILIAPAGLCGHLSFWQLAKRVMIDERVYGLKEHIVDPKAPARNRLRRKIAVQYFFKNPLLALRELKAVAAINALALMNEVQQSGVSVFIVLAEEDKNFSL